ncbi:MAG: hypothetical protein AB7R90_10495 [Reyranellaceae bacterium]
MGWRNRYLDGRIAERAKRGKKKYLQFGKRALKWQRPGVYFEPRACSIGKAMVILTRLSEANRCDAALADRSDTSEKPGEMLGPRVKTHRAER